MPTYMDIHIIPPGTNPEDVAKAHAHDMSVQGKYGVNYSKYWLNEAEGKIFCLCHAPDEESAIRVHREAHGLVPDKLIQIEPEMAQLFLGSGEINPAGAVVMPGPVGSVRDPGIRTILFTDIVDSTPLTQRTGDEGMFELLQVHDSVVRTALADLGGREIKHTGDGIMASFVSAAAAVKCATRIQSDLATHSCNKPDDLLKVRIGMAAGEPVEHHDDLFGCTVQMAARLCGAAEAAQILVSNVVAELCQGKALAFQDMGEMNLKGFDQPVRVHCATWTAQPAVTA